MTKVFKTQQEFIKEFKNGSVALRRDGVKLWLLESTLRVCMADKDLTLSEAERSFGELFACSESELLYFGKDCLQTDNFITVLDFLTLPIFEQKEKKDKSNKLTYELDFDFIKQMAERMQSNKGKYEPYNWQKQIDIEDLKQALFRHVIAFMSGEARDDGREYGHIEAIACNAMMINYQLKNNEKGTF